MTERSWRINVAPVRRASRLDRTSNRWSAAAREGALSGVPEVALIPPGPRLRRDGVAGCLLIGALALLLLKPWGGQRLADDTAPAPPQPPAAGPAGLSLGPLVLPLAVFAPSPQQCMADIGWRVCALSPSGEQTTRNVFAPDAAPLASGLEGPVRPAVVLATTSGASLAFYAPPGFYAVTQSHADTSGGEPAWGTVSAFGWVVDPTDRATLTIKLSAVGPLGRGPQVAGNVFVPAFDPLLTAERWPAGRYVVWLKGGGLRSWEEFFDFEVLPAAPPATTTGIEPGRGVPFRG